MDGRSAIGAYAAASTGMDGVLVRSELVALLGGRRAAAAALRAGEWARVLRGTYVPAGTVVDLAVRAAAAQRLLPAHAHVADRCLLWLLGVDVLPSGPPVLEAVVPRGAVVPQRAGVRVRQAALPPEDRRLLGGDLRVLRPGRAAADLVRMLPLTDAVVVADAVLHAGLVTPEQLARDVAAQAGLRGVRAARRALALADGRAESPPETRVRLLLVQAGLAPVPQYDVRTPDGRWIARVDLAFPRARVAIEYDGREVHLRGDVFARDRQRQNELLAAGWVVLRYTADDLRRPQLLVAQVRAAVLRAA